ncbi:nucleotide sugar dehydrogenase [Labilibacter marinus]|uniref:nucleotide sugar dehydrogenase n=1 Tax=Labilibacter marinus TaxID=1477105 RepID=UPI00094F9A18|nr:nucleotide sugar dehydrogenase [Labilibacter marinus]
MSTNNEKTKIAIVGLGYVGLPLAVEFAKKYRTIGLDIDSNRVSELQKGNDSTLEISSEELESVIDNKTNNNYLKLTSDRNFISDCNVFIVTVPTPTDKNHHPDLSPLIKASETVGLNLEKGDLVIYESTVYPGVTEEECIPELERVSGLNFNSDFFVGYSPERINPGDKVRTLTKILKLTSGSTPETAERVDRLYKSIITAGTFKASSIKVAEAAKVIENSQRDINIAFVNELAIIFSKLNIDTNEVLEAAGTKWNFLPFRPGLVGGHCIGVDPYYLAQKAQETGYSPDIILAGRKMNDGMGVWIASQIIRKMLLAGHTIKDSKVLCLGITFKENCPDIRNTKVVDLINELNLLGCKVDIYDPQASITEVNKEYQLDCINNESDLNDKRYNAIILAVAHSEFLEMDLEKYKTDQSSIIYDIKAVLPKETVDYRL